MKKAVSFILTLVAVFGLLATPFNVAAATADSKAGKVSLTSGTLNIRKSASKNSAVLSSLKNGAYITLISKSGNWWKVEYKNSAYGYCHGDYIKTVSGTPKKVKLTSGTLNVRKGAGTSYSVVDSLANGKTVIQLSSSNGWSRILYNGTKLGYVSSKYLTATSTSTKYKDINLNVPDFKQNDSRWAKVKIGSSGKTIGDIGCATTAIAMIESFRTKTTVYPDAMAKNLSYTSSGNVYWPAHLKAVTSSSGYLNKIYEQLLSGKAVLIGAKNSSGSQHWVVIKGYKGGDSLKTDNFIINDPGSKTRTTLKAFLSVYPTFYKYFTY